MLNLHHRPNETADSVVLFVHGLLGSPYGTWKLFPKFVFEDDHHGRVDVAIFRYATTVRPGLSSKDAFSTSIAKLSEYIGVLSQHYKRVYLVGHSLGGLISMLAARQFLELREHGTGVIPLAGIFAIASPRAGTKFASRYLQAMVPAFRVLASMSGTSAALDTYFSSKVQTRNVAQIYGSNFHIPVFACIAASDFIVNPFSAGFGVPEDQRHTHRGGHRSAAKPSDPRSEQVMWLLQCLVDNKEVRDQMERESLHSPVEMNKTTVSRSDLITEIWFESDRDEWERAYNDVRRSASGPDLTIHDSRDKPDAPVDLLLSLAEADPVIARATRERQKVRTAHQNRKRSDRLSVKLTAVGANFQSASLVIREWLDELDYQPHIEVGGCIDQELPDRLARWIRQLIERDIQRSPSASLRIDQDIDRGGLRGRSPEEF